MPWTERQHRLFEGIKHGSIKPKDGLTKEKASEMADEGVKKTKKPKHKLLYKEDK